MFARRRGKLPFCGAESGCGFDFLRRSWSFEDLFEVSIRGQSRIRWFRESHLKHFFRSELFWILVSRDPIRLLLSLFLVLSFSSCWCKCSQCLAIQETEFISIWNQSRSLDLFYCDWLWNAFNRWICVPTKLDTLGICSSLSNEWRLFVRFPWLMMGCESFDTNLVWRTRHNHPPLHI